MKKLSKTIKPTAINHAVSMASHALRMCETPDGVVAGPHHFVDLWARDSFFATHGMFHQSESPMVCKTIESFLRFQRNDGLIPYRVMRSKSTIGKYFGKPTLLKQMTPNYYSHMSLGLVPDGGLTAIIATALYIKRYGDMVWLKKNYKKLIHAIEWYERKFHGELITEWFQCEWADGVLKSGKTLYTNMLYVKALRDVVELSRRMRDTVAVKKYTKRAAEVYKKFHYEFWNGTYFVDWIDWKKQQYFTSHANFLAIIYGIATQKEATSIISYAQTHCLNTFTLHNVYPAYPFWRIPIFQIIGGVSQYHNRGILWLQPGITYALALHTIGRTTEAKNFLNRIADHIVLHRTVFEVYEPTGEPLHRPLYKSEGPFAWSSGLFLWASREIFGIA